MNSEEVRSEHCFYVPRRASEAQKTNSIRHPEQGDFVAAVEGSKNQPCISDIYMPLAEGLCPVRPPSVLLSKRVLAETFAVFCETFTDLSDGKCHFEQGLIPRREI